MMHAGHRDESPRRIEAARRRFLRGAGFAIALPFLPSLAPRRARANTRRQRLVFWFQPDGLGTGGRDHFYPRGGETDFTWNRVTARLDPIRRDVVVLQGLDNTSSPGTGGEAHYAHMRSCLTSGEPNSIDQVIADRLDARTPFKTLEIGVATDSGAKQSHMIYRGGRGVPPQEDPNRVFARLFGERRDTPEQMAQLAQIQRRRKSILDGVHKELAFLGRSAGAEDRGQLEAHGTALRELEQSLERLNASMADASCASPRVDMSALAGQPKYRGSWDHPGGTVPNLEKIVPVQHRLLVMALRCDLTRVASVTFLRSNSGQTYPFLPIRNKGKFNHSFAHSWRGTAGGEDDFVTIMQWRCDVFRELVQLLRTTPDGTDTLLDNTLVVWLSDYANGDHGSRNVPYVMAGGAGGRLRGGRFLKYPGQPHGRMLLSIAHAMNVPLPRFGAGAAPLTGLFT
jgi:hypothetical protein